jgi:predicted metalloprotease with PDZ domain
MMAAEMDGLIRSKTGGRRRLRDALRHLMAWSGKERRGFRVDELPAILEAGTGVDVRAIFEKWLAPQADPESAVLK